ncbi:polymorphic toxin type 43 domain-containing protein [Sorangium sp. So ce362]|uniref:polymorphic toxin type 43 domain-containing protein n=1 Tax=Sorangium sp. So ce362 TaxID=3133303 RepID=UPI003F609EE7
MGSNSAVGGTIWREDARLRTDEHSGHLGHLWTPEIRTQFTEFMQSFGVKVSHSATWR